MKRLVLPAAAALLLGALVPSAAAAPGPLALQNYERVVSAPIVDPAGAQTFGTVECPIGKHALGGGVLISGSSLQENLSSTWPEPNGVYWNAQVNNAGPADGSFRVYAACVDAVPQQQVIRGADFTVAPGTQASGTVSCPSPKVPLSGGGFSSTPSVAVNLSSSVPLNTGWQVSINNATRSEVIGHAYVMCGRKPLGYRQVSGPVRTVQPQQQGSAKRNCPAGFVVTGGGAEVDSVSVAANLNSTYPSANGTWLSYVNNGSSVPVDIATWAVCAKVAA